MGLAYFVMTPLVSPFYLSLNGTNWKRGQVKLNLLVPHCGLSRSGYRLALNKPNNLNSPERNVLLQRFPGQFGKDRIK